MIDQLMSEPLSIRAWSRYFKVRRSALKPVLVRYGAEPVGSRWRLPLLRCPPSYLQDAGIARITAVEVVFADGSRWHNSSRLSLDDSHD